MAVSRRTVLKSAAAAGALLIGARISAPAIAQNKPVRIGILAPRSGIAAALVSGKIAGAATPVAVAVTV